jgi:hypothetical protein
VKTNNPGKPHDQLRALGAPRELIEWVRKLPTDTAARTAWVDATRANWMPYLAVMRGFSVDAVLRATCECALDKATALEEPEGSRLLPVLRDAAMRGREAFGPVEKEMADLRLALIAWGNRTQPRARPEWMFWAELVFELARATSRGNALVGVAQAMRMLVTADPRGRAARATQTELVASLREKLTLGA